MSEESEEVPWEVQKKLNYWDERRRATGALEELMEGKIRYLKFIKTKMGADAVNEAFGEFVKDQYIKNMGGLTKLGANFLKKISKKILLGKIITGFYINMQHLVDLNCIKKMEFNNGQAETIIQKCTAKRAWKLGLKNNNVKELFSEEEYCEKLCVPLFKKLLAVADATSSSELEKRGCLHKIKIEKK